MSDERYWRVIHPDGAPVFAMKDPKAWVERLEADNARLKRTLNGITDAAKMAIRKCPICQLHEKGGHCLCAQ